MTDEKVGKLYEEIKTFDSYSVVEQIVKGIYVLLENYGFNKDKKDVIFKEIKTMNEDLNKKIKIRTLKDINKKIKLLEKIININIIKEDIDKNEIIHFFILLSKFPNSIEWIKEKNEKDFQNLEKFIIDSDKNEHLTLKVINLVELKKIFEEELNCGSGKKLLTKLLDKLNNPNENKIINYMENFKYLNNLNDMKEVDSKRKENLLITIKNSIFYINYSEKKQKYELENIKFEENEKLNEYKELIQNSYFAISHLIDDNNYNNESYKNWENIININNDIINFISLLNNKRNYLDKHEKIELKIINNNLFHINNNKSLQEIIETLKKEEENEKIILKKKYENDDILIFFYGNQIDYLNNLLKINDYDKIKNFIPYNFNNDIVIYNPNGRFEDKNYTFEEKLNNISDYFNSIFDINNIKLESLYIKNVIKNNNYDNKIIYIKSFFDEQYDCDCINIFVSLTGNLPLLSNLLIYNKETLEEEILCFLFRVIKCKSNSLFVLIYQDDSYKKNNNKIKSLFSLINEFISRKNNKSIFLILFSDKNEDIIFDNIKKYKPFTFKFNENNNQIKEKITENKVSIICSDICGAGKSEYIKKNIRRNQIYIYFPLGGYLTRVDLIDRLKNEIENKIQENRECIIHFDLSESKFENILKEFLFNFLILKYYGHNEKIFNYNYYKSKIKIKIEIPNTYINFFDKYRILNYIPIEKKIKIKDNQLNNIPIIKEEKKIETIRDSKIQIVSKILEMYNSDEIKIKKPDLDSKIFISENKCSEIINNCLINNIKQLKNKNEYQPNFYQKNIFLTFLSSEFLKFIECYHLDPSNFENEIDEYFQDLRKNIIDSLIKNSIYFTFSPFDSIINEKIDDLTKFQNNRDREKIYDNFIEELENKMEDSIISYDKINPSILAFHDKGILFSIISTNKDDKKYIQVNKYLYSLFLEYYPNNEYKMMKTPIELEKDGKLLDELLRIITDEDKVIDNIKTIVSEKFKNYVFTRDNFIKMILLILRIRAGLPTILMGETGCGKTYLLEMFSLLYCQNPENIYTLKFHSGIKDKDINDFIQNSIKENEKKEKELIDKFSKEFDDDYKKDIEKKSNEEKRIRDNMNIFESFINKFYNTIITPEGYKKYNKDNIKKAIEKKIKNRKIIIFFDEINTCNSLGLIKQIMCDKSYREKYKIPDRFIIICACNPYRILNKNNQKLQFGLNLRNTKKRKLVYTVNPLPFSLFNFVLDFKDLTKETTKKYIEIMTKEMSRESEFIEKLLEMSHFFVKEKSDISSVSLREIQRFNKMYKFFDKYLKEDRKIKSQNQREKEAVILSLYFCYYLRLPTKLLRNEYLEEIKKIEDIPFIEVSKRESEFITDKILDGKKEYVKNKALIENLFCEYVCILNKEPLIICGKPGASKSLSIQLLIDAMRGKFSSNKFFRKYEEVIPSFYQCSLTSNSESVQKVFDRARNKLKNNNNSINSLVYMDEMGIADESKNNPLKVLHNELDKNIKYNENEKISFIGISNWSLDASKMNRAINIVVEEPDEDSIIETAKEIAKAINEVIECKSQKLISSISKAYYYYINDYQPNQGKVDFHGFRDFYYLIKYIFNNISEKYSKNIEDYNSDKCLEFVYKGIIRNFGGIEKSITIIKQKFLKFYFDENKKMDEISNYNVINSIYENIDSKINSRYLLLIGKNELNEKLLKEILKDKKYEIISDKDLEVYDNKNNGVLNLLLKIQLLMENEIILILKNLEILYPSLYELFNKNYNKYGNNKKFTRISYENKQSLLYVNDNFRIIILVEEKYIDYEDKPFLNRFEKHILSIDNLLDERLLKITEECYDSINKLISIEDNDKIINLKNHLINVDLEKIKNMIFMMNKDKTFSIENLLSNIVPLFSQELILLVNYNNINIEGESRNSLIKLLYKDKYKKSCNLEFYLSNLGKDSFQNVIYTFSDINSKVNEIIKKIHSSKKIFLDLLENIDIDDFKRKLMKIIIIYSLLN